MSDYKDVAAKAKKLVAEYVAKTGYETHPDEVYVVWYVKVLQNVKLLLSTDIPDGRYYEVTYNGSTEEIYFDAYVKEENWAVRLEEV